MAAWLAESWQAGWLRLLAGVLLATVGAVAMIVTVGMVEQQRHTLAAAQPGEPAALEAETAVVGLALGVERVPPELEAGAQVVVLNVGGGGAKQPLVGGAGVTSVSALSGDDSAKVRVGVEVPADAAGAVADAGAQDRVALAALPMA